jgi:hypothetical protein
MLVLGQQPSPPSPPVSLEQLLAT